MQITISCNTPALIKIIGKEKFSEITPEVFNPITVDKFNIAMYAVNCVAATRGQETVMYIANNDAEIILPIHVSINIYVVTTALLFQSNQRTPESGEDKPKVA